MKYVKIAGILWGLIYFVVGALKSFTLNSIDFWSSTALLFAVFLLPLPIAFVGVWFPRIAGKILFGCITVSMAAAVSAIASRGLSPLRDIGVFIAFIAMYDIPHLLFGWAYIRAGQ